MKTPARPASTASGRVGAETKSGVLPRGVFALLLAATLIAYGPSLSGDFLWDDAGHVTNPTLQSWSGLARIWIEPGATQQYYPLLHSAFWLEHKLWGDAPLGYRLVNVVWHTLSAWLLIALLRRLALPGALLAGFLFALHPVAVESVAWISEQKNTLSTVFYLTAALAWLAYEEDRRPARYALASAWFLAALLTKTVTATLPAALLVLAWWRRGRITWRGDVLPLLPWLAAGVAAGLFTAWFERTGIGAQGTGFEHGLLERFLLAGRNAWFYLGTLLWPANLAFHYPPWSADVSRAAHYAPALAALLLLAALAWYARRQRGPLAATLLFGGTLFPALGFIDVYPFIFSPVADHFQYLASLGVFAFIAAGLTRAVGGGLRTWTRAQAATAGTALVLMLGVLSFAQSRHYVEPVTLYRATLKRSPDSWIAHHNLAVELAARGEVGEALTHSRRAVELKPDFPEALNNLADNLARSGRPAEAPPLLERALRLKPKFARAENTWGVALAMLGRRDEATRRFQRAIELEPRLAEAHYNLGLTRAESGDFRAAIADFSRTIQLQPTHAGAELNWGLALALSDRLPEARGHFQRALELDPDSAAARQIYARVLLRAGELEDAAALLREAFDLEPNLPGLRGELEETLRRLGRR